jgi:FSR family fosmidomycin resistance protein-like MFS transporter
MSEKKQPFISKPLALLALSHAVTDLSQGALPVLLPFLKNAFGLTYAQVGVIVLAQNFTSSVIQPLFGYITDRLSLPWLLPLGVILSGIGMAVTGLVGSYHLLLFTVIVAGLGIAAFHPQASKGAHFVSAGPNKGRNMGIFSVGGNLGHACGAIFMTMLLTLPGVTDNTLYFCLPAALATLLLWLNLKQVSPEDAPRTAAGTKTASRSPLPHVLLTILLLFIFLRSSIHAGLTTYIPLYYVDYLSGSPIYASYLLSVFLLAGVAGTFTGGTLSDRIGRKTVIMGSMLLTLPLLSLIQYTSGVATLALMAVIGFTLISSFVTTLVLAQEMMPGYEAMAAGLTIGFSIGLGGVGATLFGYAADYYGVPIIFTILAVLPAAAFCLAYFLPGKLFRRDTAPAKSH